MRKVDDGDKRKGKRKKKKKKENNYVYSGHLLMSLPVDRANADRLERRTLMPKNQSL